MVTPGIYVEGDHITLKIIRKLLLIRSLADQIFVGKNYDLIKVGDEIK